MTELRGAKVLVTGGHGFLGQHIMAALKARGADALAFRSAEFDLLDWTQTQKLFEKAQPDVVIHNAWTGGGIGWMRSHPASASRDNALMACHVLEASKNANIKKFVGVGSICSYPKFTPVPFKEADLWNGYPEETNAPYGIAKKMLLVMTQSYREQYGLNGAHLLMVNMYGPQDDFDLETSHVIPAMFRKFLTAKEKGVHGVTLWGDGSPTREFIYVTDAAEAVVAAAEKLESSEPVNVGSGTEISIRELASTIQNIVGYQGAIEWDTSKPNGQPRRLLDVSKAEKLFGFRAKMPLQQGLLETYQWYLSAGRSLEP